MKRLLLSAFVGFSLWQALAFADDTDIYLTPSSNPAAPHLMLMFDYRTDMTATFCSANGGSSCTNKLAAYPDLLAALQGIVGVGNAADNISAVMAVFQVVFAKFEGIFVGLMMPNSSNGGTILRGYCEFRIEDLNGDGDTDDSLASLDETIIGTDLNGNGDTLDTAVTLVSEAAVDKDLNCDGDKVDSKAGPFVEADVNGAKAELIAILQSIPVGGSGAGYFHEVAPKETHFELYRYLNGGLVEYGDQTASNFQGSATPNYDSRIMTGNGANLAYVSPFSNPGVDYSCTKLYEVYATSGNEGGNEDDDLDAAIATAMDSTADDDFDGMVAYMSTHDLVDDTLATGTQSLKTWFIQMGSAATNTDDWSSTAGTIDQYMNVGGNNVQLANIQATLEAVFIEALSVSSTFVSASVPVNVFNRIQTLDNFFIALFEARATERWPGNIKKLKLYDSDADGEYDDIIDVNSLSAFSDNDGRIKFEALTYWTDPISLPTANPENGEVAGRDGRTVSRGGAGQKIPGFTGTGPGTVNGTGTRQLYVEPSSGTAFVELNADATTATNLQTLLGASTQAQALSLIKWARGQDVDDEDLDGNVTESRSWILGDAIHSRPLALNYGATTGYSTSNPNIRLFMGTNDGFFHIFENTTTLGAESGKETFAFLPRELLGNFKKLRSDTGVNTHPYGVDGEPVAFVSDVDNDGTIETGDEVYVYVGLRRGGKSYYALDVSNPSALPSLKWKITKTSGGNFDELGYTFATPRVVKVRYENTARDVLIFSGGYDLQKDNPGAAGRVADSEGNAIYIVDAATGALIWKATQGSATATNTVSQHTDMLFSIPSSVTPLDTDSNEIVDRLYVGDTGGNIWRIDLPEHSPIGTVDSNHRRDNWTVTKFADVSDSTDNSDLRFFHAPDIVQTSDSVGQYDGILIESGDRANPLETVDENFLFLIKDRNTASGSPPSTVIDDSNLADTTPCITGSESGCSLLDYANGWKIELADTGEKGLASPLAAAGKVFFTSYTPSTGLSSCEPSEGNGKLYVVNLKDGTATYNNRATDIGPGIPPAVTAIGDDTLIIPGSGIINPFDTSGSTDRTKLIQTGGKSMFIIYWREEGIDSL
jgi:type IV pilus assembly protein PilY1